MTNIHLAVTSPHDVNVAIEKFLKAFQTGTYPFANSEALKAIRNMFPGLDITDSELQRALLRQTATRGFEVDIAIISHLPGHGVAGSEQRYRKQESRKERRETRRRIVNDTVGTRRRAHETKERNRLI
ncbi:hypothetical protein [Aquamicrobium ahrensii]|uniref:Uncharacterized protein n=1 Tax=Aquamicrobium ahrensii TaxID=469551 RepID=A0ABV2KFS2_9HYPH